VTLVKWVKHRNTGLLLALVAFAAMLLAFAATAHAQTPATPPGQGAVGGLLGHGLLGLGMGVGAGLAIGLGAVGTGIAQSRIGGAAAGVVAERPEMFGIMLVLLVIPETLVIFGFVIAFFLYGKI
jgi:V/A-type H+-transporting ATPase subunit K